MVNNYILSLLCPFNALFCSERAFFNDELSWSFLFIYFVYLPLLWNMDIFIANDGRIVCVAFIDVDLFWHQLLLSEPCIKSAFTFPDLCNDNYTCLRHICIDIGGIINYTPVAFLCVAYLLCFLLLIVLCVLRITSTDWFVFECFTFFIYVLCSRKLFFWSIERLYVALVVGCHNCIYVEDRYSTWMYLQLLTNA